MAQPTCPACRVGLRGAVLPDSNPLLCGFSVTWLRRVEARVFGCIAVVRLLLVPAANLLLVRTLYAFRLLPRDPVCALTPACAGACHVAPPPLLSVHCRGALNKRYIDV